MMNSLKDCNQHYRDEHIVFDEEPHIYYVNKKPISTSVTTLVHNYFAKFDADGVIDKMMRGRYWTSSKYFGKTKDEIKDEWKANGLDATTHGTNMHKTIEQYYNNWELEHPDTPEFDMFLKFYEDHKLCLQAYRTEWEVYDEDHDLAGSIDMVFNNMDGTYSIYDWKRTKEIKMKNDWKKYGLDVMNEYHDCNYIHYSLQLNIYKNILERKYDLQIRDMYLVCMHPNYKSYKKIEVCDLQKEVGVILENRREHLLSTNDVS